MSRICSTLALLVVILRTGVAPAAQPAPPANTEGVLATGYPYRISVPGSWNGVVISDLDAVANADDPLTAYLLERHYAYVGTGRHPERMTKHDPVTELEAQVEVLRTVAEKYGTPKRTIQFGCSGGGFVALGMAEKHAAVIDGAVAFNARGTGGIAVANTWLDLPFALKALLAPGSDLKVAPVTPADLPSAYDAWKPVLDKAQQTAEGRARIALAVVVSQYPGWGAIGAPPPPKPAGADLDSLQQAMFRSASDGLRNTVTRRQLYDNPAGLASWNVGVDYARFYNDGADAEQKRIVTLLFERAGLRGEAGVAADLAQINAQPRIQGSREGVEYWLEPGRLLDGDIKVPLLHVHGVGDALLPPHLLAGYAIGVAKKGKADLYRTAFIDAPGHCAQSVGEAAAAIEAMVQRLETGRWSDTSPDALNRRAGALKREPARFVTRAFTPFNRAFFPGSPQPFAK